MRLSRSVGLAVLLLAGASLTWGGQAYVWVEGEDAVAHTMQRHNWYDSVKKENLSGGEWLSHFAAGAPPTADYRLSIGEEGVYHFWIRANSVAGPRLSYQMDDGPWVEVDLGRAVENINIAVDGKPDMRFISWINAGPVSLSTGPHRLVVKFHSANNNHGALDCFVLSREPFMPRGLLRPGQRTSNANPGYFAWEPPADPFTADALLDLRELNEDTAGATGYVRAKDNGFVLGDGQPVKFWVANAGGVIHRLDHDSHVVLARHLAKRGVNMVRLHGGIYSSRDPAVDTRKLDNIHHFVRALKEEGIYTKLSFYFPAWFRLDPWHTEQDRWCFMLLFFDLDMQRIYFNWADALLKTPNPYTGIPLGQDPAVAIVEIQNEDSHFFWTFGKKNVPPDRWRTLQRIYGDWLRKKYGTLDKAVAAWGGVTTSDDGPDEGRMDLLDAWNMTADGLRAAPRNRPRIIDQVRFLTENMRGFYQKAIDHFRTSCGYEGLVSSGNWRTADPGLLEPLEQYCYSVGDVIDHHGYFDHNHKGDGANWSVRPGHTFTSQSAIRLQYANPLPYIEIDGHPSIVSEIGWPMPNMYRAEWPFLTAVYGSLSGLDAIGHFSVNSAGWDQGVGKFPMNTPVVLGGFFATSLLYRNGYVQEAPSVVQEHLAIEDLLALKGSPVVVEAAMDQLRADQIPAGRSGRIEQAVDPAVFYVGRITRSFAGRPNQSRLMDITTRIDREAKTITSATGEVRLDYGRGLVTVDTPKVQGAAGFLGRVGKVRLAGAAIDMANDYGTVLVVSLDDQPLATSRKILIQCMTIDQPYGWRTSEPDGLAGTIRSLGSAPWGMERIKAAVTLRLNGSGVRVIACDENGYATDKKTTVSTAPGGLKIDIDETSPYTIVLR